MLLALIGFCLPSWAVDPPTRVVRVSEVSGQAYWFDPEQREWEQVVRNQTLAEGDRLRVDNNGRVGLRIGASALWLDERSQMELMRLDDERFDITLDRGSLALRLVTRETARDVVVRTPEGHFAFERAGSYRVDAKGNASRGQVFEGRMSFEHRGQEGSPVWLQADESAEVWWANGPRAERGGLRLDSFGEWLSSAAGFGREEVARYASRPSYRYVSPELTGADELDSNGRWETTVEFGPIWYPSRVAVGWAPYRDGRWTWTRHWGWTWVDDLPWGYATSHYGRWVFWGNRWCWSPGRVIVPRPVFAPALVAWVGGPHLQVGVQIGGRVAPPVAWVPLAPYETYRPWYRHSPGYIRRFNPDPDPVTVRRPPVQGWAGNNRAVPGAISMYAASQGDQHVPRAVPVRDEALARSFTPLQQAPTRTEMPFAGPARGRVLSNEGDNSPRMRAGGSQGLPTRTAESGPTARVPSSQGTPVESGSLPLRAAPAPWVRGAEAREAGRDAWRDTGRGNVPLSTPAVPPTASPAVQAPPPVQNPGIIPERLRPQERPVQPFNGGNDGVPRRFERPSVDDAPQRRAPVFDRSPEPEQPVRRYEAPRPQPEQRREEAMPWRQPAPVQQHREEAPQRRFEAPRMETPQPPPQPRFEMPTRRPEPPPQAAPAPQRRVDRDDGVPRKRGEHER